MFFVLFEGLTFFKQSTTVYASPVTLHWCVCPLPLFEMAISNKRGKKAAEMIFNGGDRVYSYVCFE